MGQPMALDTPEEWLADAMEAIVTLASTGNRFSSDDLRWAMRPAPHPNLVGNAFRVAYRKGLITECGTTCSKATSRRGSLIRQWVAT